MRMLVVGAGATGGYFGGRLAQAGRDVTFLVRPARAASLRAHGLQIVSPHGNATLNPKLVIGGQIQEPFDVVLLSVKSFSLATVIEDCAPAVGDRTLILPVLNGMRHMEMLAARFGAAALVGGLCMIVATVDADGRIVQLEPMHELVYGELDGTASPRVGALDALMQGANFTARLSLSIQREMWQKWILLSAIGGITCLIRGNIGEIEAAPAGRELALTLLDEVVRIVRAVGEAPSEPFLHAAAAMLTTPGSTLTTSMFRDLQQGSPTEAEQIIGDLLVRAQQSDIDAPLLRAAYANLCVYQRRLAR
jgi:2-dehydropantoate 2-reductase